MRRRAHPEDGGHPLAELGLECRVVLEPLLLLEGRIEGRHRHAVRARVVLPAFSRPFPSFVTPFAWFGGGGANGEMSLGRGGVTKKERKRRNRHPPPT